MSDLLFHRLPVAALVVSIGLAIAWTFGLVIDPETWLARAGLLVIGFGLAAGATTIFGRRLSRQRRKVQQHLEDLCSIDPRDLCGNMVNDLPHLPSQCPWCSTAERVRQTLMDQGRRLAELEHLQTAATIRNRRLAEENAQIRAVLSGLSEPIIAVDDFGELLLANPTAENLFEFKVGEGESRALAQLVHCEELVKLLSTTSERKSSSTRTNEIEVRGNDGAARWYRATAAKLSVVGEESESDRGRHRGAVAVLRDIGEQKVLQKRHAEFVSAVSHEMKTPLAGIKAYVELLVDGDAEDEETREEFLDVINGQADRLQRLIDNMLNLARIEAGVVSVNKQPQSLNELLEEALRVVQPAAEAKRIELAEELSSMYLGVLADRDMLLQSAINLLSNAVKYTPEGGRIVMRSRLDDGQARFEVEDTGVGLSEEDCRLVFERFYRVSKDKNMASGTGLGLPLAKHIVEDVHGGRLWVESVVDEGSTFIVTIPGAGQLT